MSIGVGGHKRIPLGGRDRNAHAGIIPIQNSVSRIGALDYNFIAADLNLAPMTSPYTPRPALKIASGYIVHHSVQKRFPAFLRCNALHFVSEDEFTHAELAASPAEYRNAVAKLSTSPILGPLSGGAAVVVYLAGRGLEEDFRELADELQEDSLKRLAIIPQESDPIVVIFGDNVFSGSVGARLHVAA